MFNSGGVPGDQYMLMDVLFSLESTNIVGIIVETMESGICGKLELGRLLDDGDTSLD